LWPADTRHSAEAFLRKQDAVADSSVHRVQSDYRLSPVGAVEIERLNQKNLPPLVAGVFLGGDQVADDSADQHLFPRFDI
jgi:hypothetical protein